MQLDKTLFSVKLSINTCSKELPHCYSLKQEMRRQGIIKQICTLIGQTSTAEELMCHLVDALHTLALNNLENCEEIWWENGFSHILHLVEVRRWELSLLIPAELWLMKKQHGNYKLFLMYLYLLSDFRLKKMECYWLGLCIASKKL